MSDDEFVHGVRSRLERLITELVLATPQDKSQTPKPGRYLLNTDASVRNGEGSIGIVLSDPADRPVAMLSDTIGRATIPQAEYTALKQGLQFARDRHVTKIRAYLDNQTVVDQLNNDKTKVSADVAELRADVMGLLAEFPDHRLYWVPRERNRVADALARSGATAIGKAK